MFSDAKRNADEFNCQSAKSLVDLKHNRCLHSGDDFVLTDALTTFGVYTKHAEHFLVSAIDDKHKNFQILNFRIEFLSGGARPVKFGMPFLLKATTKDGRVYDLSTQCKTPFFAGYIKLTDEPTSCIFTFRTSSNELAEEAIPYNCKCLQLCIVDTTSGRVDPLTVYKSPGTRLEGGYLVWNQQSDHRSAYIAIASDNGGCQPCCPPDSGACSASNLSSLLPQHVEEQVDVSAVRMSEDAAWHHFVDASHNLDLNTIKESRSHHIIIWNRLLSLLQQGTEAARTEKIRVLDVLYQREQNRWTQLLAASSEYYSTVAECGRKKRVINCAYLWGDTPEEALWNGHGDSLDGSCTNEQSQKLKDQAIEIKDSSCSSILAKSKLVFNRSLLLHMTVARDLETLDGSGRLRNLAEALQNQLMTRLVPRDSCDDNNRSSPCTNSAHLAHFEDVWQCSSCKLPLTSKKFYALETGASTALSSAISGGSMLGSALLGAAYEPVLDIGQWIGQEVVGQYLSLKLAASYFPHLNPGNFGSFFLGQSLGLIPVPGTSWVGQKIATQILSVLPSSILGRVYASLSDLAGSSGARVAMANTSSVTGDSPHGVSAILPACVASLESTPLLKPPEESAFRHHCRSCGLALCSTCMGNFHCVLDPFCPRSHAVCHACAEAFYKTKQAKLPECQ